MIDATILSQKRYIASPHEAQRQAHSNHVRREESAGMSCVNASLLGSQ
jgi:hypothetical protein